MSESRTRAIKRRVVLTTTNKENFFKILNEVLRKHGLEGEAIKDLLAGQTQTVSSVRDFLQARGEFLGTLASLLVGSREAYLLEPFIASLDNVGAGFVDQYTREWIAELTTHADKNARDIMSDSIDSVRVLIFEIYCRIFIQALRTDSKLPAHMSRLIWIEVLKDLNIQLLTKEQLNKVGVDIPFQETLITIQANWLNKLKNIITRIEEIGKGEKIVKATSNYLEEVQKQSMRMIIVELIDEKQANEDWTCCLDTLPMLMHKLEEVESDWIRRYQKNNKKASQELVGSADASIYIINHKSIKPFEKDKELLAFTLQDSKLVSLGALTKEEAARQQFIITHATNSHRVIELYALYNWTISINLYVGNFGDLIHLAGYMPMLLEKIKTEPFDDMMQAHEKVWKQLLHFKYLTSIRNTNIYGNLLVYITKAAGLNLTPAHAFKQLTNEVYLKNIRAFIGSALKGMLDFGQVLNCSMMHGLDTKTLSSHLPAQKISTSPDIGGAETSSAPQISSSIQSLMGYELTADQLLLIGSDTNPFEFHYPPMQVSYIMNLFHGAKLINYNHEHNFKDKAFFKHSGEFVMRVRQVVEEFEVILNKYAFVSKYRDYWNRRNEEVYWTKYLCVQTELSGDIRNLKIFLNEMVQDPYISSYFHFDAYQYDKLPKAISAILQEFRTKPGMALMKGSSEQDVIMENQKLTMRYCQDELRLQDKDKKIAELQTTHETIKTHHQQELAAVKTEAEKQLKEKQTVIDQQNEQISKLETQGKKNTDQIDDLYKMFSSFKTDSDAQKKEMQAEMQAKNEKDVKELEVRLTKKRDEEMEAAAKSAAIMQEVHLKELDAIKKAQAEILKKQDEDYQAKLEVKNAEIKRLLQPAPVPSPTTESVQPGSAHPEGIFGTQQRAHSISSSVAIESVSPKKTYEVNK